MAIGDIQLLPTLKDNLTYLLEVAPEQVAVIDPSEAGPVVAFLKQRHLRLRAILNTHHHWDHVGGNEALQQHAQCPIYTSEKDVARVPGVARALREGEALPLGEVRLEVLAIPGHTLGHMALYAPGLSAVFTGDTLFAMGCGRLFEGTAEQMWASLQRLAALPPETRVYCGHEYTLANLQFVRSLGEVAGLGDYEQELKLRLKERGSTLPSTVAEELRYNPFLRTPDPESFAKMRARKDAWNT